MCATYRPAGLIWTATVVRRCVLYRIRRPADWALIDAAGAGVGAAPVVTTALVVGGGAVILYAAAHSTPTDDQMAMGEGQVRLPEEGTQQQGQTQEQGQSGGL